MKELIWKCELSKMDTLQVSDNVFDLLSKTIDSLDSNVRKLLDIASCVGNTFSHDLLQKVFHDNVNFEHALSLALESGWIVEYSVQGGDNKYRFLHDKMQQTIHMFLIRKIELKIHYKIGCYLEKSREHEDKQILLACVNHFNLGASYVKDKSFLGKLNLDAARYAKENGDFESALIYIRKSIELTFVNISMEDTVEMLKLRAECEHLCNHSDEAIVFYEKALELAHTRLQKSHIYELLIKLYSDTTEFSKAYEVGMAALKDYGIDIPKKFIPPLLIADFIRLKYKLRRYSTKDLIHLPVSEDDDFKMIIKLLANILQAAYQIQPELCVANALIIVRLCLENGLTKESVIGFTVFGVIFQGAILGNHELGYEYSQLSFEMLKKYDNTTQHAEVKFVCGYFGISWRLPAVETEENWDKAYQNGLEIGDWFHTGCAATGIIQSMFMRGVVFEDILQQIECFEKIILSIGMKEQHGAILSVKQAILNLTGKTIENESFGTKEFDEVKYVETLEGYRSEHFAHYYFINKMITLYIHQSYKEALIISTKGKKFSKSSKGMLHDTEYMFYDAMIKAKLYDEVGVLLKHKYKRRLKKSKQKFLVWAEACPENFLVRKYLLEAELYRIQHRDKEAFICYDKAIEGAKVYTQVHLLAIANRLMGELYTKLKQHSAAKLYDDQSVLYFNKWGINNSAYLKENEAFDFDIHALMKASEVITKEHDFSSLLSTLMRVIIESSGGQYGFLLLEKEGEFLIQASADGTKKSVSVMQKIPYQEHNKLVHSVINYVLRSKETIVVDNMMQSNIFGTSYVSSRVVRSVLCAPLMLHGELKGIIYLENNLLTGVFTANKVQLLQHLGGQIIISIENTTVYHDLEEKIKQRTEDLENSKEELQLLASTDPMTKLYNRRYFSDIAEKMFDKNKREHKTLSLIMLDIDNFKKINDTYGHHIGDNVIISIANILMEHTRESDTVCRYGGEEYMILLSETNTHRCLEIAELIRLSVENMTIKLERNRELKVTISIGISITDLLVDNNIEITINKADNALYEAKRSGKNRVIRYLES